MTPINIDNEISVKPSEKSEDKKPAVVHRKQVSRKFNGGMFDVPEIIAVMVAGLALLGVAFAYFFMLLPAREEFKTREAERSQKQTELLNLQTKAQEAGNNAAGTVDLMSSVDRFETDVLPLPANGNGALYQRLNELIRSNNLRNTAGPAYAPLETIDASRAAKATNQQGRGNKQQGVFPGTYVTVTVEGSYASLRHFISDLENTRQFLIINAIEIESNGNAETTNGLPTANGTRPEIIPDAADGAPLSVDPRLENNGASASSVPANGAAKRGAVTMRLEMAAYFRRVPPEQSKVQN